MSHIIQILHIAIQRLIFNLTYFFNFTLHIISHYDSSSQVLLSVKPLYSNKCERSKQDLKYMNF